MKAFLRSMGGMRPNRNRLINKPSSLLLILFFVSCGAQTERTTNIIIDHEITPLKIGDKIPYDLWEIYCKKQIHFRQFFAKVFYHLRSKNTLSIPVFFGEYIFSIQWYS